MAKQKDAELTLSHKYIKIMFDQLLNIRQFW